MQVDDLADLLGIAEPDSVDTIHESELADLLGITANRVRTLARDGVLKRSGRASYNRREAVRAYCGNLREKASRLGRPATAESDALKSESIRVKRAQADAQELKNAALRGELLDATAVERQWASILRDLRAGLLAVPSRVGAKLPHLTAHDLSEIDREIRHSLERLSDGN